MDEINIKISDFDYNLQENRIAKFPVKQRDKSSLLIYDKGDIKKDVFSHITSYLPQKSLMVFNNTKVIQARINFFKSSGAHIEVFLLEPKSPADYEQAFQAKKTSSWLCMIGNQKKWKTGALEKELDFEEKKVILKVEKKAANLSSQEVKFLWDDEDLSFADILEKAGELPIPPYLNRKTQASDSITYQTIYSKIKGSVAAPTAGLHFTDKVLKDISSKGIDKEELTLHVGAGTFRPVKTELISSHDMHTEFYSVKRSTIEKLLSHQESAIAVGTTTVRTLESLYFVGVKLEKRKQEPSLDLHVGQWEPYSSFKEITVKRALENILSFMDVNKMDVFQGTTQIIIVPGYKYRIVKMLITNFHQPKSTLLLLVSAFVGEDWKKIYNFALENDFRFLSYGDSSLLIPKNDLTF